VSLTTHLSFVLVAFSEPWRADQLGQLVRAVRPGARVVQVNDGHAALTVCKRQVPSLMIADGELDGLDGRALLQELRRHGPTQKLACILVSERMDLASVQAVRPLRLAGYLGKPCNFDDLRQRLDRLLPQSAAVTPARADTPSGTLEAFLDRMREHNRGAPLLASVQAAVGDCLSAGSLDLGALEAQFARDPQITARLIGLANSAASHQGLSCQTLGQALPRLGVKRTLNLVLEMATQRNAMLADPRLASQAQQIAAYAQGTASMAEWLARRLKLDAELCYTAGLLHNIGELALLRSLQDWLDSGGEVPDEAIEPLLRERSAGFGSALRAQWRLPLALRQAIAGFYALGAGVHSREALVLNLSRLLLELPASSSVASLAEARAVRLLRIDPQLLGAVPRA